MTERFSDRYALNPKNRSFSGKGYETFYPNEILHPIFKRLKIAEADYPAACQKVLNAAFSYENHKTTVLERQSTPAKERKADISLAKKATAFLQAYSKLDDFSFMGMVSRARTVDSTIPQTIVFPSIASIALVAEIAAKAATTQKPIIPHFAPSHTHLVWLSGVAPLFKDSKIPLSVNTFHLDKGKSEALEILHALMMPLDPFVKIDQLAEALKLYLKQTGTGQLRKKTNKSG